MSTILGFGEEEGVDGRNYSFCTSVEGEIRKLNSLRKRVEEKEVVSKFKRSTELEAKQTKRMIFRYIAT